ncbi:MAG TPA: hypothetical protein VF700_03225 [Segetibacter sp.]
MPIANLTFSTLKILMKATAVEYNYGFTNYKELVIDALKRFCMVSAETMKGVGEMEANTK